MKARLLPGLVLTWLVFLPSALFAQESANKPSDAAATVKAFYAFHFHRKCDFSLAGLKLERKWLDDNLYGLLLAQLKKPVKQDEVPDLEGDPFTNSQDPPNSFSVTESKEDDTGASVNVSLLWKEQNKIVDQRKIEVRLKKSSSGWKIANIISGNTDDDDLVRFLKHSS